MSNGFFKIPRSQVGLKVVLMRSPRGLDEGFFVDFAWVPLSKLCFPQRAESTFLRKMDKMMKEMVCRALNAQRKQQMACEFDKKTSAIHKILFADWALEAKNARVVGHNEIFHRLLERKKAEPNEQRSDRNGQSDENSRFALLLGVQKVIFLMQDGVV